MDINKKHIIIIGLLAFSFPVITLFSSTKEYRMFWVTAWSLSYFAINVFFEGRKNSKYNLRIIQEYALMSLLGIALMSGVIYYEY